MVFTTNNTSKVTPFEVQVPTPKQNNFLEKGKDFVYNFRSIIAAEVFLGINRLYLLKCDGLVTKLHYFYVTVLCIIIICSMVFGEADDGSYTMFRGTVYLEYLLLILSSLTNKKTLKNFFQQLSSFDDMLNIRKEIYGYFPARELLLKLLFFISYSLCECLSFHYALDWSMYDIPFMVLFLALLLHDCEQIFFCLIIKTITLRLKVLKAHIQREFKADKGITDEKPENEVLDKIEVLSNNTYLDTTSLHRAYELLHGCTEDLNSVMSFPMIVMLFSSGLNTTVLMKRFFQITQLTERTKVDDVMLVFAAVRSLKFTLLVILPCYYASLTYRQVTTIRSTLHNAVNTFKIGKLERRKIKAFFQLTQDSDFAFALWGVIRLSMSLPLSYASLCTTYLVIFIQFSKFID